MSERKDQKELIQVTKNQALGMGGVGMAITTIVALTSTFLTSDDGRILQSQIDENKVSIRSLQTEIKDGFRDQDKSIKEAVKELEKILRESQSQQWSKSDHDRYALTINDRIKMIENRIEKFEK